MDTPVSVFDYLDFRAYLADVYVQKKAEGRSFSYRAFSRRAGLKSPNHLKLVIDGQRSLTPHSALRYVKALRLDEDEAAYFIDLVSFNQASSTAERIDAYQALTRSPWLPASAEARHHVRSLLFTLVHPGHPRDGHAK